MYYPKLSSSPSLNNFAGAVVFRFGYIYSHFALASPRCFASYEVVPDGQCREFVVFHCHFYMFVMMCTVFC